MTFLRGNHVDELPGPAPVEAHDVVVPDDALGGLADAVHLHLSHVVNHSLVDIVRLRTPGLDRPPGLLRTATHLPRHRNHETRLTSKQI